MKPWNNLTNFDGGPEVLNEMRKKYQDTVLGIKMPSGKIVYGFYKGFHGDSHVFDPDPNGELPAINLKDNTECDVFVPQPLKGFQQVRDKTYFLQREPLRQFMRSLCKQNTSLYNLTDSLFNGKINKFKEIILDYLNANVPNEKLKEQVFSFVDKNGSLAITPDFAITQNHNKEEDDVYSLWFGLNFIGFVYPKTKTIKIINEIFMQEVIDTQRSWCSDYLIRN